MTIMLIMGGFVLILGVVLQNSSGEFLRLTMKAKGDKKYDFEQLEKLFGKCLIILGSFNLLSVLERETLFLFNLLGLNNPNYLFLICF